MGSLFTPSLRRLAFIVLVTVASGIAWLVLWQVFQSLFGFTEIKRGITLVYVPAGVRLVILLVSGLWGAVGLALAFPFALLQQFPDVSWEEIIAYSVIAGFIPYVTVLWVCRAAKVSRDLSSLRSIHLPLLSAAVSVLGAVAYSAALVAFGRFEANSFLKDVTAMAAGDFLGCFTVILLVRLILIARKKRD